MEETWGRFHQHAQVQLFQAHKLGHSTSFDQQIDAQLHSLLSALSTPNV